MRGACLPRQESAFSEGSENPFGTGVHEDFLKTETRRAAKAEAEPRSLQGGRQAPTKCPGDVRAKALERQTTTDNAWPQKFGFALLKHKLCHEDEFVRSNRLKYVDSILLKQFVQAERKSILCTLPKKRTPSLPQLSNDALSSAGPEA
jgi:hypothetical protein